MKIITRNNTTYVRHWFRWYWLIGDFMRPLTKDYSEDE